ncbi:hypothetical protein [Pseudonocardia sp. HH130630-07]|uniref:hypothetical protein n=1 Tax=Pseudonocardia sp. HH130630-07 TaxID=1690815 RepID=UPI0008152FEC|nr:hypothetical protein [Pseudonocardia sp. HH130630-07]ANY08231.1 hypothetical protein AFB00_20315 [Pseudonocardia sp. HH130630-07]
MALVPIFIGGIYTYRNFAWPSRHRRRLTRILTGAHTAAVLDIDWQQIDRLLLDDICARAADHHWYLAGQALYRDRWNLAFHRTPTPGPRTPAALHDHYYAESCACTDTDYRFTWEDEENPVDGPHRKS